MMIEGYGVKTMTDKQRIATLEAQLAEANEMRIAEANEMRIAEANEMRIADLEAQLAAATEDARLQRALDRIEAGESYFVSLNRNAGGWDCNAFYSSCYRSKTYRGHSFESAVEAAEAAAVWAEGQKEG